MAFFRIVTFGCKVNQCDSQILRETLISWGLSEAKADRIDLLIINTCTVTGGADAKFRKALRKARRENAGALIVVTGCYASRKQPSEPPAGTDLVLPPKQLAPLVEFLKVKGMLEQSPASYETRQSSFAEHTRAFLKIQDGCDCYCSYCIVPLVRPNLWRQQPHEVVAAINRLCAKGYKEVVLTGIHLGFYGREQTGGISLSSLLAQIETNCSINRIRLSSIEINEAPDELVDLMARSSRICRHLHIPLQSGDNEVLERMNRRYSADFFLRRIGEIRDKIPDVGVTTDIIAGFPGETDEQFERTCKLTDQLEFTKIHVFRYSRRPGTRAAGFNSPVPPNVMSERARRLISIGNDAAIRYKRRFIGRTLEVLVEAYDRRRQTCHGLAPNYIRVKADADKDCANTIVPMRIREIDHETGLAFGTKSESCDVSTARQPLTNSGF